MKGRPQGEGFTMGASADATREIFERQKAHTVQAFSQRIADGSVEIWFDHDNADYWGGFEVVMREVRVVFSHIAPRRILTIGDGKGGKEAAFFRGLGHRATASDLCIEVLREAQRRGLIEEFAEENAECLSFRDDAFDIAFCKESLHHMQRPYLAIYEMIRVAREAAVLIEPWYRHPSCRQVAPVACLQRCVRRLLMWSALRRLEPHPLPEARYEEAGNFRFRVNPYELVQCARAMGLPSIAIGHAHSAAGSNLGQIRGEALERFKREKEREMAARDRMFGREARPLLVFFLFKHPMASDFQLALVEAGFKVVHLSAPASTK